MTLAMHLARTVEPAVPLPTAVLQRRCDCGKHTAGAGCTSCEDEQLQRRAVAGPRPLTLPARAISRPSDPAELAAERTADRLLSGGTPAPGPMAPTRSRAPMPDLAGLPPVVGEVLHGSGRPLDAATRAEFEPRLGADLSRVRVHTGQRAASSAEAVSAHGYTVGWDIVLGRTADRRTLAHELAHAVGTPGAVLARDFNGDLHICHRVLESRTFDVANGRVTVDVDAQWNPDEDPANRPASSRCTIPYFQISLRKSRWGPDREISTNPVPVGRRAHREWSGLSDGEYYLFIWVSNSNPTCCLQGSISVSTAATTPQAQQASIPQLPSTVLFDGDRLQVRKGGRAHACAALSGTVGDPTPEGQYCIRRQGEAQVAGGIRGRLFQDRDKWFLIEPVFTTKRSRMQIHPGTMSSGCITVMDRDCFDEFAGILNDGGTSTATGYDGYPPGNDDGVNNAPRTVDCVGTLTVTKARAPQPSGATVTP